MNIIKIPAAILLLTAPVIASAQGSTLKPSSNASKVKSVQSGEIKLETNTKQKDPYETAVEAGKQYLNDLQTVLRSNASGGTSKAPEATDAALSYLTTAYLICSVNSGVCKHFLDVLLEADVIESRLAKKDSCKTLRSFWKKYLSNDLEARHKYATKIGFLAETGEFNTKVRPRYIKCVDTVKKERQGEMSDSEFFKQRYSDGKAGEALEKVLAFIKVIDEKNINLFNEIRNMR